VHSSSFPPLPSPRWRPNTDNTHGAFSGGAHGGMCPSGCLGIELGGVVPWWACYFFKRSWSGRPMLMVPWRFRTWREAIFWIGMISSFTTNWLSMRLRHTWA
jgi:hypothetical protein